MFKRLMAIVLVVAAIAGCLVMPVSAAGNGSSFSGAINANYGSSYHLSWTSSTDQDIHYAKFVVPARGVVTINAPKPTDDSGNYGGLQFTIYDSNQNPVWDNHSYGAVNDDSNRFVLKVGLAAGTYYMSVQAGFYVWSGTITGSYSLSFKQDNNCEIEPNENESQALGIAMGTTYHGWHGSGSGDYEENDYYKFNVVKDQKYTFVLQNAQKFADTTTIIHYIDPNGTTGSMLYYLEKDVDEKGFGYVEITPEQTGVAYIRFWNYSNKPLEYSFRIVEAPICQVRGHAYENKVTLPTLSTNGYTTRACRYCDYSYVENYTFPDVRSKEWYYRSVEFSVAKGFFSGHGDGTFGPSNGITRQDFVVVLARLAKADLSKYSGYTSFTDVSPNAYYAKAIHWASENRVVMGYNDTEFGVDDKITREQLVTILYRYAMQKGYNISVSGNAMNKLNAFGDSHRISAYSKTACAWALEKGVLSGKNATTFDPTGAATRAQVATMLMNISLKGIMPI